METERFKWEIYFCLATLQPFKRILRHNIDYFLKNRIHEKLRFYFFYFERSVFLVFLKI